MCVSERGMKEREDERENKLVHEDTESIFTQAPIFTHRPVSSIYYVYMYVQVCMHGHTTSVHNVVYITTTSLSSTLGSYEVVV